MQISIYGFVIIFLIAPGIFLILASYRFRRVFKSNSGLLFVLGSIFILLSLISNSGIMLVSSFADVELLAQYALINAWVKGISEYIGLILISIALYIHAAKVKK